MLTFLSGYINYVTKDKIFLIHLDTISACPQNIVSMTEKDLTEALKNTACKITSIAALHPSPRATSSFLFSCEYSVGNCLREVGVATITKVPVGLGKFRFILRVCKYSRYLNRLYATDYEEAGPAQQLTGTCEAGIGVSALFYPRALT